MASKKAASEIDRPGGLLAGCKPLGDRVLILRDKVTNTTPSGIILPNQSAQPPEQTGTVIRVGPECKKINAHDHYLRPNARVIFLSWAGLAISDPLNPAQDDYALLREEDIIATI